MFKLNLQERKVALYGRCATLLQADENTARQEQELRAYAHHNGSNGTVSYMDVGSGLRGDRPALKRLLEDAHEGKIDTVLVTDFSRLARSASLLTAIKGVFKKAGVALIAVQQRTSPAEAALMNQLLNAFGGYERAMHAARIRRGLRARKHKK